MHYTRRFRSVCLVTISLVIALPAMAQEIDYKDLTGLAANPLACKKFIPDSSCNGRSGGGVGITVGCPIRTYPFELFVLSVDTNELSEGSEAFVLLRLQNVGHEAASVPWITEHDQIELPDETGSFSFSGADLRANVSQDGGTTYVSIPVRLYGAKGVPASLKEIRPGEYVEISVGVLIDCNPATLGCRTLRAGEGKLSITWTESDNRVTYENAALKDLSR
jgi:hypothetical protein